MGIFDKYLTKGEKINLNQFATNDQEFLKAAKKCGGFTRVYIGNIYKDPCVFAITSSLVLMSDDFRCGCFIRLSDIEGL